MVFVLLRARESKLVVDFPVQECMIQGEASQRALAAPEGSRVTDPVRSRGPISVQEVTTKIHVPKGLFKDTDHEEVNVKLWSTDNIERRTGQPCVPG